MRKLLTIGLVGFVAQLIDGSLGMAYGLTSTTLLLTAGVAPAIASASVHLAEVGTTLASGTAHWRFGNVDWRVVALMSVPGAIGGFAGAVVLTSLSAEAAAPAISVFLFALGAYVLLRFARRPRERARRRRLPALFLAPLGAFAGFMDAAGGGGWGPIGTPTLLSSGRLEPRKVVGSIDTGEFLVALGASAGFLVALPLTSLDPGLIGAMLTGGLIAAPIAAWLVRNLPSRILGTAVGGMIVVTNARSFAAAVEVPGDVRLALYLSVGAIAMAAFATAVAAHRREQPV
jgi:uncharacterized membrane protein YfcA